MQLKWPMLWDLFSLFPAHAGVIPFILRHLGQRSTFPRTRGGDPIEQVQKWLEDAFSPHTRG